MAVRRGLGVWELWGHVGRPSAGIGGHGHLQSLTPAVRCLMMPAPPQAWHYCSTPVAQYTTRLSTFPLQHLVLLLSSEIVPWTIEPSMSSLMPRACLAMPAPNTRIRSKREG